MVEADSDLGESRDLPRKHPKLVRELTALLAKIRALGHTRPPIDISGHIMFRYAFQR